VSDGLQAEECGQAELSVLGGVMLDNHAIRVALKHITPDSFSTTRGRLAFGIMCQLDAAGEPIDPVTMVHAVERMSGAHALSGDDALEWLLGLTDATATAVNISNHAQRVQAGHDARKHYAWMLRETERAREYTTISNPRAEVQQSMSDVAEYATAAMHGAQNEQHSISLRHAMTAAVKLVEARRDIWKRRCNGEDVQLDGIFETPWPEVDALLGGLEAGMFYLVGARTGDGKTAFLMQMAVQIALACNKTDTAQSGGELFSTEVPGRDLAIRAIARAGKVDGLDMRRGHVDQGKIERMAVGVSVNQYADLMLHHRPGMTVEWVRDTARYRAAELKRQGRKIGPVWVDYAQDLRTARDFPSERMQLKYVAGVLDSLAGELDTPVIAACQLLRGNPDRPPKPPTKSSIRGGDDLANPATGVILLYRPAMQGAEGSKSDTRVIFDKSRNGETGMVRFTFDGPTQAFEPVRGGGWQR
jgi:replicative DNA helicase